MTIVTKEDLDEFRLQLLEDITQIIAPKSPGL